MRGYRHILLMIAVVSMVACAGTLSAFVIDFSQYGSGSIIDNEYQVGSNTRNTAVDTILPSNVGFSVAASGGAGIAVLYNANLSDGEDPDLEFNPSSESRTQYSAGNQSSVMQGNVLIVQESATQAEIDSSTATQVGSLTYPDGLSSQGPGFAPDDQASGNNTITFTFSVGIDSFGFNWVDLDDQSVENFSVILRNTSLSTEAEIDFDLFDSAGTIANDPVFNPIGNPSGVVFGDGSANQVEPITAFDVVNSTNTSWSNNNPIFFDQVVFNLGGSGSLSQLNFTVPEPGTAVFGLLLVGLIGLNRRYRRRK